MVDPEFLDFQRALAGEYSLERELGRGGMGVVYLAREVQLDRHVAIKVLPGALAARQDVRERFLREARMAASLSHPHIVPIYRVGEAKGFVFFVMAYVSGETLGERLRTRGPLSAAAATRMLREVAWALSYAHGRGIVHRDIKPDNILLEADTGRAFVTDFGIARGADESALSDPGSIMGTAHFMSPEQAAAESLDGRSDLYSLGVVAYLALSGRLPFNAPNVPALLAQHVGAEVPALAAVAPSVPRPLVAVIDRLLRKSPADRYVSGEALAEALADAAAPARAGSPMALRVWASALDPLRGAYPMWEAFIGWTLLSEFIYGARGDIPFVLALALLPAISTGVFHARKAYQVFNAGYRLPDLRAALAARDHERGEELGFERAQGESRWATTLQRLSWLLGAGFTAGLAGVVALRGPAMWALLTGTAVTFSLSRALGASAFGERRRPGAGAIRSMFWNSPLGEWAASLLTPANRTAIADLESRPTEIGLGMAVDDLFAALPATYRQHLSDLPAVVRRLEAHATAARARLDELNAVASSTGDAGTLTAARDDAKRKLADSVAALEAVRLDLLRLHGGATDLRPITTVLEAARVLGEQLGRLHDAAREVSGFIAPLDLRPHTPA